MAGGAMLWLPEGAPPHAGSRAKGVHAYGTGRMITPRGPIAMDALSDLLRVVRLDSAYFYAVEAAAPWRVETVSMQELSPRVLPGVDHLIPYHMLTAGHCYAGLRGGEQVELSAGDVIVFPHGDAHVLSSELVTGIDTTFVRSPPSRYPHTVVLGSQGAPSASFICGYLGCDRRPFNPLIAALPRRMHLRAVSSTGLGAFTRQLSEESRVGRAAADLVLTRLAELMFIEVLRRYLDELPPSQTGWLAGLRDEVVGRTLTVLHARPGKAWTLAGIAREVASSRTNLTKRFTGLMGQAPMQYLAQWRMQVAANLLIESTAKVATIGAEVGYDSEAAFSRAFKKATGVAPGAWRAMRRAATP
jgi:AraC-like DNA-binding protein